MKKAYLLGLAASALLAGMYVQGCSGSDGSDGGTGGSVQACNSDADCGAGICNTVGHVCMQKCTAGADCPDSAKTCAQITGATSAPVCQCSTDALCGGGSSYCNNADKLCEVKCSDNSGCSGFNPARTCVNSQCVAGGSNTDGGADGGNTGCNGGAACQANETCTSNGCLQTCTSPDSQGGCQAGQACFPLSSGTGDVCDNVGNPEPAQGAASVCSIANPTSWTPTSAPTVWGVHSTGQRDTSNDATNNCSTNTTDTFSGFWYDPTNTTPTGTTGATYANIYEVTSAGGAIGNTYFKTAINTDGTFSFELCTDNSANVDGVAIKNGSGNFSNTACIR